MKLLLMLGAVLLFLLLFGMYASANAARQGIEKAKTQWRRNTPALGPGPVGAQVPSGSPVQVRLGEIKELFALYQSGALTREEFDDAKSQLLGSLSPAQDNSR